MAFVDSLAAFFRTQADAWTLYRNVLTTIVSLDKEVKINAEIPLRGLVEVRKLPAGPTLIRVIHRLLHRPESGHAATLKQNQLTIAKVIGFREYTQPWLRQIIEAIDAAPKVTATRSVQFRIGGEVVEFPVDPTDTITSLVDAIRWMFEDSVSILALQVKPSIYSPIARFKPPVTRLRTDDLETMATTQVGSLFAAATTTYEFEVENITLKVAAEQKLQADARQRELEYQQKQRVVKANQQEVKAKCEEAERVRQLEMAAYMDDRSHRNIRSPVPEAGQSRGAMYSKRWEVHNMKIAAKYATEDSVGRRLTDDNN